MPRGRRPPGPEKVESWENGVRTGRAGSGNPVFTPDCSRRDVGEEAVTAGEADGTCTPRRSLGPRTVLGDRGPELEAWGYQRTRQEGRPDVPVLTPTTESPTQ